MSEVATTRIGLNIGKELALETGLKSLLDQEEESSGRKTTSPDSALTFSSPLSE